MDNEVPSAIPDLGEIDDGGEVLSLDLGFHFSAKDVNFVLWASFTSMVK